MADIADANVLYPDPLLPPHVRVATLYWPGAQLAGNDPST
jgi:hypothetical protein